MYIRVPVLSYQIIGISDFKIVKSLCMSSVADFRRSLLLVWSHINSRFIIDIQDKVDGIWQLDFMQELARGVEMPDRAGFDPLEAWAELQMEVLAVGVHGLAPLEGALEDSFGHVILYIFKVSPGAAVKSPSPGRVRK